MKTASLIQALELGTRHVVAVAGSGGKTTLVLRLARELHAEGKRVAVTTTTRMGVSERISGGTTVFARGVTELRGGMEDAFLRGSLPFLFADAGDGKHVGLPPETIDALAEGADVLLVEADGAKARPLKFPRPFEPVVPDSADRYIVVLGASGVGKPLGDDVFFHVEGALRFLSPGDPLTPGAVAALLHAGDGFLRHARPGRKTFFFVNQTDAASPSTVRELERRLGHGAVHGILSGTLAEKETALEVVSNRNHRVGAVVLAAGESRRFGSPKLLAPVRGRPMILSAVEAARRSGVEKVRVVLGHRASDIEAILESTPETDIVVNERFGEGLSSSIRAGLAGLEGFDAALLVLGDLPFLGSALPARVVEEYRACTAPLCFPLVEGRPGHPVIFRRDLWDELRAVRGDTGGRSVLRKHADRARTFPHHDPSTQVDIDTLDEYKARGYSR